MRFAGAPTWDRSGRQKVSSNRSAASAGNKHRNGPPVTTTHLFWPNQQRKAASPLRNWQPNSRFPAWNSATPGGGGSGAANQRMASIEKGTRNFMANRRAAQFA
jgi:hypothetical protein